MRLGCRRGYAPLYRRTGRLAKGSGRLYLGLGFAGNCSGNGQRTALLTGSICWTVPENRVQAPDQLVIAKRLAEKVDCPGLKDLGADPVLRKGSNENDREMMAVLDEVMLQLDSAQTRHL